MSEIEDTSVNPSDEAPASGPGWEVPDELKSLEAKLAALVPRGDRLDRERLMFLAGQASAAESACTEPRVLRRTWRRWTWPAAFGSMTSVAAMLFVMLLIARSENSQARRSPVNRADPIATDKLRTRTLPLATSGDSNQPAILLTIDAYRENAEQWILGHDLSSADAESTLPNQTAIERERSVLTPNSWHEVLYETNSNSLPSNDSSNVLPLRGTNS